MITAFVSTSDVTATATATTTTPRATTVTVDLATGIVSTTMKGANRQKSSTRKNTVRKRMKDFCLRCWSKVWRRTQLTRQMLVKKGIAPRAQNPSPVPSRRQDIAYSALLVGALRELQHAG